MAVVGKSRIAVSVAKNSGFCFGVERAAQKLEQTIKQNESSEVKIRIYTLGHLIHNQTYIERLEGLGVYSVDTEEIERLAPTASALAPVKVFIRAHGIPAWTEKRLEYLHKEYPWFDYFDCTCPFVKKIHKIAENASVSASDKTKKPLFILIGTETHPEVVGIMSYFTGEKYVFESAEAFEAAIENDILSSICESSPIMAAQTTLKLSEWEKCQKLLKSICTNSIIFDTICSVTEKRQTEADALSRHSDVMIVIGGKESSNTAKLYSICRRHCERTVWIESADELENVFQFNIFRDNAVACVNVGIVAGASTPSDIIQEVVKTMSENFESHEVENFEELLDSSFKTLNIGDIVVGTVTLVTDAELQLDIKAKNTGVIPADQITDDPSAKLTEMYKVGDTVEGFVTRVSDVDGFAYLSKKRVDSDRNWQNIVLAKDNGAVLEGKVIEAVKGGVVVLSNSVKVFIPASQTGVQRDGDLSVLVGSNVKFKIIDIKPGKKAVGSIKTVLSEERKARVEDFWNNIEVGKVYDGVVKNLTSYGAFVDLGGVDGLILLSELTWKRVPSPADVVSVGDHISVYVKSFDAEKKKIVLGHKTEETNPWYIFTTNYAVGDVVKAKIVNIVPFGAFAEIIDGVDGLIHISEISNKRIAKVDDVLTVGDVVDVEIIDIDSEKKKVSLSMKALISNEDAAEEVAPVEEAPADAE